MKICHIGDLHIRGLQRHAEYKKVFEELIEKAKEDKIDHWLVAGDIFHTKTSGITPEYIDFLTWLLLGMEKIAPVHLTLGNHDGNLMNADRQDAISPIVAALNNPRIFLYKKSGNYEFEDGYNFCVFSIFDQENWNEVEPSSGKFNIAVYHGPVSGCVLDNGCVTYEGVPLSFFDDYDCCMLGDIHINQFLAYRECELEINEDELDNYPEARIIK